MKQLIFLRSKVESLCYYAAMLGYKLTTDWIVDHVPEASYLINDYIKKHPDERMSLFSKYFKSPENIMKNAEKDMDISENLKKRSEDSEA